MLVLLVLIQRLPQMLRGRVTAGENPTTLAGYGITDAVNKTGDTMTGLLKYSSEVSEVSYDDNTLVTKKYADSVALGYVFHVSCATRLK